METASPEYILYGILRDYGFRPAMVKQIYENINGQTGRQWMSMEYIAAIDRGYIDIARRRDTFTEMTLPIEGCYVVDGDARIDIRAVEVESHGGVARCLEGEVPPDLEKSHARRQVHTVGYEREQARQRLPDRQEDEHNSKTTPAMPGRCGRRYPLACGAQNT